MSSKNRTKRALKRSRRGQRIAAKKAPQLIEGEKFLLAVRNGKCSSQVTSALRSFSAMKKTHSKCLSKARPGIKPHRPFEDPESMELLCKSYDASLFALGSHSKKRPHCLTLGRMFDHALLDVYEFQLNADTFKDMDSLSQGRESVLRVHSRPLMVFQGSLFGTDALCVRLKSLFLDMFRARPEVDKINLAGLDRLVVVTATDEDTGEEVTSAPKEAPKSTSGDSKPSLFESVLMQIQSSQNWTDKSTETSAPSQNQDEEDSNQEQQQQRLVHGGFDQQIEPGVPALPNRRINIHIRQYGVLFRRSGTRFPRVKLEEAGPRMDMTVRRFMQGPVEMWRAAMKVPYEVKQRKKKNILTNALGETLGRIHKGVQNFDDLNLRRTKATRDERKQAKLASRAAAKEQRANDESDSGSSDGGDSSSESSSGESSSGDDMPTHQVKRRKV